MNLYKYLSQGQSLLNQIRSLYNLHKATKMSATHKVNQSLYNKLFFIQISPTRIF